MINNKKHQATKLISLVVAILILTVAAACASNYDAAIKKNRMGTNTLTIKNKNGQTMSGMKVSYELVDRAFKFGVFDDVYNPAIVDKMKAAGVDYVTLLLNWRLTEPSPGKYDWSNTEVFYDAEACYNAGLKVKATALVWFTPDHFPEYLRGKSFSEVKAHAERHVRAVVRRYKKYVDMWNVVNEPMASWANELHFTDNQMIDIIKTTSRVVRQEDPTAKIMVNHADPISFYSAFPLSFVKKMEKANVDYDVIGLQSYYDPYYMNFNGVPMKTEDLNKMIDEYVKFGKEIQISEISVSSTPNNETNAWTQDRQADWLETAYSLYYARKEITAITWWNSTDRIPFVVSGGLIETTGKEKKAYSRLKNLLNNKWNSNGSGKTNSRGRFVINGFAGTYNVTVTDPKSGMSKTIQMKIEERKSKSLVSKFLEKKIRQDINKKNTELQKEIKNRRQLLTNLANYWDKEGNKTKAGIARSVLASTQNAPSSADAQMVLPAAYENTLNKLEETLDTTAVERKVVLKGRDMDGTQGLWVFKDWNMDFYSFGRVFKSLEFKGRSAKVTVRAAGSWANDWPVFSIVIGNVSNAKEAMLKQGGWTNYTFDMDYTPGKHQVDLAFVNDWSNASGGRDLFVESITIVENSWVAPK